MYSLSKYENIIFSKISLLLLNQLKIDINRLNIETLNFLASLAFDTLSIRYSFDKYRSHNTIVI